MIVKNNKTILAALAAGIICLLVYLPALNCDFINYDDNVFVTNNPAIRILDMEFLKWAFTTSYQGWWMPLVWVSFAIDYHFWGLNPFGFHLTNILLHAVNVGLVVLISDRVLRLSGFKVGSTNGENLGWGHCAIFLLAGLLWGLHPINVESVAWVVERKNVLNGIFSLSCILFYLIYLEKKDLAGERGVAVRNYVFSALLMLLALMTKPVSVVIPPILLVLDFCLFGRLQKGTIWRVLSEKIPYLVLSVLIAITTILLASGQSILVPLETYPLISRCFSSGAALFDYCVWMLYPVGITAMNLIPNPLPISYIIKTAIILCLTVFCIYSAKRMAWLTAIWLCFILPILPTLHFLINGAHSICSHFAYLPSVAPCIAIAALSGISNQKLKMRSGLLRLLVGSVIMFLLVFYILMTENLLKAWKNSETIWTRVINIKPVGRAYFYRAIYLVDKGRYSEAIDDLQISIKMALSAGYPNVNELYALRADSLHKIGRFEEALAGFTEAIKVNPRPNYFYHRGLVFKTLGRSKEAEYDFSVAGKDTSPIDSK